MSYKTDKIDDRVVQIIKAGGVGLLPSDTIYGLSCPAMNQAAVEKIHSLKDRDEHKPFIILIPSLQILDLLSILPNQAAAADKYWPGKLSVILSAPAAPAWLLRGGQTLAVRWPDRPALIKLMNEVGPLISTSANLQGEPPVTSSAEAESIFGDQLDFYVDAGSLQGEPSTLAKIEDGKLQVVRQGAVKIDKEEEQK